MNTRTASRPTPRSFFARAGALVALALALGAGKPDLSASPGALCVQQFLAMVGDPTPVAVQGFEGTWASKKRAGAATIDERIERMKGLHAAWGALTVVQVRGSDERDVAVLVRSANKGLMEIRPEFSDTEPGRLDALTIADGPGVQESRALSGEDRARIVAEAAKALREGYVYPEVGEKMAASLEAQLKAGAYDGVEDESSLAARLTKDCRAVSNDRHLRVVVAPGRESAEDEEHGPSAQEMRAENYAFRKVELLAGNIGYLKFDAFVDTEEAKATGAAAMAFLEHCDALIVDLRQNGGGSPEMIQFLTSYLFDEKVHLNDMVDRDGKIVEEYWTLEDVPGEKLRQDLPVYVLTSSRTFSGAEEFSYNLQNLKRATLVGETTGGGAHPVRPARLDERFMMIVPYMRAQNPISHRNWEGTGVEPDVKVPAAEALDKAQALAREAIANPGSAKK